MFLLKTNHFK